VWRLIAAPPTLPIIAASKAVIPGISGITVRRRFSSLFRQHRPVPDTGALDASHRFLLSTVLLCRRVRPEVSNGPAMSKGQRMFERNHRVQVLRCYSFECGIENASTVAFTDVLAVRQQVCCWR
jgi:hypothetical protein